MISTNYMALGSQKKIAKMPAYTGSGNTHSPSAQTDNTKSQSSFVFSLDMTKKAVQYSILNIGSRGTEVKKLQETLTKLGYDTKGTDGVFGANTKNAVMAFQKAQGILADGIAGMVTQVALSKALNYHKKGILTEGSRGTAVKELQQSLTKLGYDTNGIDGIFGAATKRAIVSFQRTYGLIANGIVDGITKNAITEALKNYEENLKYLASVRKMLDNIRNDTTLGLSAEKKTALVKAAERLLEDRFDPKFVAGVLGNILSEGTVGIFESSNYKDPNRRPAYLVYMDTHFDYRNSFSGKSIREVGIQAALELQQKVKESGYKGKFGLGMVQWTAERTEQLLRAYQRYASGDKPTKEECIEAEVNFMADELKGVYARVYTNWKKGAQTAASAGEIVCRQYEKPSDMSNQAKIRAQNANKIYLVMIGMA